MTKRFSYGKWTTLVFIIAVIALAGCSGRDQKQKDSFTIIDQMGRSVVIPRKIDRIAALHHFGGKIVYALKQQDKLVDQALYWNEARAMDKVDKQFAALPKLMEGHDISIEMLVSLKPQIAFVYASFDRSEIEQLTNAGISVVALRGETLKESFEAVRLAAQVLGCMDAAESYLSDCSNIISYVQKRVKDIPPGKRLKVMFTGPKSIYTVATGEMLQTEVLELAGAINVARDLKGFWADVSPEQVALWNPDVIFLGSTLDTYKIDEVLSNPQFMTVSAIRQKKVYAFPSNVGWWDYPAPHCVLGTAWAAKTLYPQRFIDTDITAIADSFYTKYLGHSFTSMGGRL